MRIASILLIFIASSATAQSSKSLEQVRKEEQLRRAVATVDDMDAKLEALMKKREAECEMAIGYKPFCGCVMKDLPIAWSFGDYIAITTKDKEENGYARLNKELRSAYDKVAPIRDACVRAINAKP